MRHQIAGFGLLGHNDTFWIAKLMIRFGFLFSGMLSFLLTGCHMNAPMHVWKTPRLSTGSAVSVAVAPVGGPEHVAEKLDKSLIATRPQTMPHLAVLYPDQLENISGIQLVSYDGQPSEMAAYGAAKRAGAQYVLSGEILQHDLEPRQVPKQRRLFSFLKKPPPDESMSVRWTVFDARTGSRIGQHTIDMDPKRAQLDYPDLAYQGSGESKVIAASARRSWEMVVPTTTATQATLDLPWLMPGSARVRKGNAFARLGQWEQAEREWQEAADLHPWNRAAWHNLSMAAVAKEDFQLARDRLEHSNLSWLPGDETAETSAWIDSIQRDYRACFQPNSSPLNPPAPMLANPEPSKNPATVKPRSLDDQPWYTIVPFMPPPGWTWKDWWYQSTLF